jgi:hypothetical protein
VFLISLQNRQDPAAADSVSCTVPGTVISDDSTVLKYILGPKEWGEVAPRPVVFKNKF